MLIFGEGTTGEFVKRQNIYMNILPWQKKTKKKKDLFSQFVK